MATDVASNSTATISQANKPLSTGVATPKLAIWIFLASEVIFFSSLIGGSILLRVQAEQWPVPGEVLNVPLTSLNTFLLIVSSVTVVKALDALQKGNQKAFKGFLVATFLIGSTFLGVQVFEYYELIHHGLTFDEYTNHAGETVNSVYGTTFYIQTGFHGAHVFLGIMWILFVTVKAFLGGYSQHNYLGVEIFGLYWHFVDLVWILLFTIVYLV